MFWRKQRELERRIKAIEEQTIYVPRSIYSTGRSSSRLNILDTLTEIIRFLGVELKETRPNRGTREFVKGR